MLTFYGSQREKDLYKAYIILKSLLIGRSYSEKAAQEFVGLIKLIRKNTNDRSRNYHYDDHYHNEFNQRHSFFHGRSPYRNIPLRVCSFCVCIRTVCVNCEISIEAGIALTYGKPVFTRLESAIVRKVVFRSICFSRRKYDALQSPCKMI